VTSRLVDRLELRWCTHRDVDGLWVGTYEPDPEAVLRRIEDALGLIKAHDRLRYDRLRRDLERVWVRTLFGNLAEFNESLGACELDVRFVLAATSSPAVIASTIVHEATHARLLRRRIGYEEKQRARVEAVCFRAELAFAKKLPDGADAIEHAERMLDLSGGNEQWSNATFDERYAEGAIDVARYVGVPIWIARAALAVHRLRMSVRRLLRRLLRR
jgi:hypothetical protein